MSEREPPENERIIGVFSDETSAEEAATAARKAGAGDVEVGAASDQIGSLQAEMKEEAAEARPGFSTPEMARSVPLAVAVAALVGIVIALPVGFMDTSDVPLATRLLLVTVVGAAIGGTIGFFFGVVVGGGFLGRRRRPKSSLAAERGVVVGASGSTGDVAPTLHASDPVRVDRAAPSPPESAETPGQEQRPDQAE